MTAAHLFLLLSLSTPLELRLSAVEPVAYPEPELAALSRLPSLSVACEQRSLCSEAIVSLEIRALWDVEAWPTLRYATWCWDVWDDLCRAQKTSYDVWERVDSLDRLRAKIGDYAFAAGRMPSPMWACREMP